MNKKTFRKNKLNVKINNQEPGIDLGRKSWNHLPLCLYLALLPTQIMNLYASLRKVFVRISLYDFDRMSPSVCHSNCLSTHYMDVF